MNGCSIVFHTASPFTVNVKDPQKELVDPAKLGTGNVLIGRRKRLPVKRVVLTSCAAIYGDNADIEQTPNGVFEIFGAIVFIARQPYSFSKTEAEKAWKIAEAQNQWDWWWSTPSLVMGPSGPQGDIGEFNIIRQMGNGDMKAARGGIRPG